MKFVIFVVLLSRWQQQVAVNAMESFLDQDFGESFNRVVRTIHVSGLGYPGDPYATPQPPRGQPFPQVPPGEPWQQANPPNPSYPNFPQNWLSNNQFWNQHQSQQPVQHMLPQSSQTQQFPHFPTGLQRPMFGQMSDAQSAQSQSPVYPGANDPLFGNPMFGK